MTDPDKETKFVVYDVDQDDFIEITMDEEDYQAMVDYENQLDIEEYERRQRSRNDDY
jgi:hypothetical protein